LNIYRPILHAISIMRGVSFIDPTSFVADIVRNDYRTADVFRKYGIEYGCGGGDYPLEVVCKIQGIDLDQVIEELEQISKNIIISGVLDFKEWEIDFLADYIINVHHAYLRKTLPDLKKMLQDLQEKHPGKYPDMQEVEKYFLHLYNGILPQLEQEETIIFPYVRQIAHAHKNRETYARLLVRTLRKPLQQIMSTEHERIFSIIKKIRELTSFYLPPDKDCLGLNVLLSKLKELDNDLQQHIYLEGRILFPRAIAMEKELLDNAS
jgi:regulator of cell morphogenesis and NO signaling